MKKTIGLFLVCTGKYDIFLQPLIDSLSPHFFCGDNVIIYIFCDKAKLTLNLPARFSIVFTPTAHRPFPYPTLYRYRYFTSVAARVQSDNCSFIFYCDVDMLFVGDVGDEILPGDVGLVATGHPGFWNGGGAWGNNQGSTSYTEENYRERYYAGGFQGGATEAYLAACAEMAGNIETDERNGTMAEWHDETHWNKYLSRRHPKTLTPEYCMVEGSADRLKYGIDNFIPRIVALEKNHDKLREFY